MISRPTRLRTVVSALFILAMGACGSVGGCGACSAVQPLPGGALPAAQTIEGGAQIRLTQRGIASLTSVVKPLLDQQLAAGFCLPGDSLALGTVAYCETNQGQCLNGCLVKPTLTSVSLGAVPGNPQAIRAHVDARAQATVPLHVLVGTCDVKVTVDHLVADVDVALGIDAASGELRIRATPITSFDFSGERFDTSGLACEAIAGLGGLVIDILHSTVADFARNLLSPAVGNVINTLVPQPLGLAGMLNVGNLLEGVSPGSEALLEARILPGGYARMQNGGLSLGVVTGINADANPATRAGALASEPARCVPAIPAPNLGIAPASLPLTSRSSYRLDAAAQFDGVPADPAADLAAGLSETMLDLAGHHLVTSGALCLGVGTTLIQQLNVGTISLLVRSLGELASDAGNDPLLLITRPQRALDFRIGDNTAESPALTIGIDHLEVDFYAFVYERYVRVFTLELSLDVGVNLDIVQAAGQGATLRPMLVGITPENVQLKVLNSQFVKETPAELEAVLPSVFSLVTPLLGNLPEITVPAFAGIRLKDLSVQHVTTTQDDFLALYGSLDPSSVVSLPGLQASAAPASPSTGRARLSSVVVPAIDQVRGALMRQPDGALPRVTFDVDRLDAAGRELEWSYQLEDGMWHVWQRGAQLVIEAPAFAWQGKYTIGLASRVKGDSSTLAEAGRFPVLIDSVAPRIAVDKAAWRDETYVVPAFDIVSGHALSFAFGKPGTTTPDTGWAQGGTIELSREDAEALRGEDGQLTVFVKDEAGNTTALRLAPFHGEPDSAGCACNTRTAPGAGSLLLILVVAGVTLGRRRSTRTLGRLGRALRRRSVRRALGTGALWVGGSIAMSLQPGCSCGKATAQSCELTSDCSPDSCNRGELPFCLEQLCVCSPDVPPGRIGPYSDVAVAPDGTIWVSAYAQTHGDLVVAKTTGGRIADEAWEWVDGVPDGPVAVPGSMIRGGIDEHGPDVGMYTSIAVAPDGTPMVSYFDRDTASLKLAQRVNGTWQIHVVDAGTGGTDPSKRVGMYTSLTVRSDDGRPGIAYLAHVTDGAGSRAEVRFASAQAPRPEAEADWQTWVVDTAALPPVDPANPAVYPLPDGLGLFIDSARLPNQAPVVAYYDRGAGDLKVARFDVKAGQFSTARVLDGSVGDAGWSPSIAIDAAGVVHVAYVGSTADDLKYITDAPNAVAEVIDDGYRIAGTTPDGQPKPELHLVGDDASIVLPPGGGAPMVLYQDATTQELLLAQKQTTGAWTHVSIAGATDPWTGGYGFFAAGALAKDALVMSSWVIDLPAEEFWNTNWVEVFTRPLPSP